MARDPDNRIAQFVRNLLAEKHWRHEDLADELKIERSSVTQWTTGRSMPDDAKLRKLAQMANVDEDFLIRLKQQVEMAKKGYQIDFKKGETLSDEERQLLDLHRSGDYAALITLVASKLRRKAA